MKIGLDLRTTSGLAGTGEYGTELAKALENAGTGEGLVRFFMPEKRVPFWTSQFRMRRIFAEAELDLLHVTGGIPPLRFRRPYVLTVHDLLIYRHPEWFPDGQWFSTKIAFPAAVRNARRIIVPSQATKRDLVEILRVEEEKIDVIPHGVRNPLRQATGTLPTLPCPKGGGGYRHPLFEKEGVGGVLENTKYILALGTIEPRKNLAFLVRAYRRFVDAGSSRRGIALRIVGPVGWKAGPILKEIRKAQEDGYAVELLGRVEAEEKWRLLAGAFCFALPSLGEGFGMPVLEALAAGAPVVASDLPVLRETAGDCAVYVRVGDEGEWAAALAEALEGGGLTGKKEAGLKRAGKMTWTECAARTLGSYGRAMRG